MSIIANNLLQGDEGYNIARSLRFRSSASAYLNRTPASVGNQRTWTWSGWVKIGLGTGNARTLIDAFSTGASRTGLTIGANGNIFFYAQDTGGGAIVNVSSVAVFRDHSAWYHICAAFDTTQATASNRTKLYINGVQQTLTYTISPALNTDYSVNYTGGHFIGRVAPSAVEFFDGYLTEVNFIDGQALTPSSFGETDSVTGVWKPKKYAGTYGTNGFYLPFSDNTSTTTLGYDKSGNSNNWTTNNISLTAGSTYDSMTDVPTMSALGSNYAVLNPLWVLGSNGTLSDGNLTDAGGGNPAKCFPATIAVKGSGKFYAEFQLTGGANYSQLAVIDISSFATSGGGIKGSGQISWDTNSIGSIYYINSTSASGTPPTTTTNDVVMVAFDANTRNVWFGKNGTWNNSSDPATATSPVGAVSGSSDLTFAIRAESTTIVANFGQRPFSYTPPTGFKALNTYNLPTPTIGATASTLASKNFDATTYTGNGSTQTVVNAGGFQPDLVWGKRRDAAGNNNLFDRLRGVTNYLTSNGVGAEISGVSGVSAFNSNGFSVGSHPDMNTSGGTFVGWQWKANGSAVSNTAGSITSQVSANASAGFSVVTYTGTGANATVGHGLGVAPSMMIVKSRSQPQSWVVWFKGFTGTEYLLLNATSAKGSAANIWNSTVPTSIVFSIGTDVSVNISGATQVAYCFSEVAGYSKCFSYTGNGSTDGVFCHLGFRPKFVMWKRTDSASGNGWYMLDSARNSYNVMGERLFPNLSNAGSNDTQADFLSNGFKLRTTDTDSNASGGTYVGIAFAENPFKYSLAR